MPGFLYGSSKVSVLRCLLGIFFKFVAMCFVLSLKVFISNLANQMLWEVCRGNHKSSSVPLLFKVKLLLNMEAQYFIYNA